MHVSRLVLFFPVMRCTHVSIEMRKKILIIIIHTLASQFLLSFWIRTSMPSCATCPIVLWMRKKRDKWNNILVPQFRYHFVTILNANTLLRVWSHYIWTFTYQQSMHIICQTHTVHTFLATVITVKRLISFFHSWTIFFLSLLLLPRFLLCPLLLFVTRVRARSSNPRQVEAIRISDSICACACESVWKICWLPLCFHWHHTNTHEFEVLHLICWHCNTFLMECASFKDGAALLLVCETCVLRSK